MAELLEEPTIQTLTQLVGTSDRQLRIPMYQRDYAWEEDQIDDFFADLRAATLSKSEHFFGTVVISKDSPGQEYRGEDEVRYLIDGQQRITTSLLMLSAIRHHHVELGNERGAARIQSHLTIDGFGEGDRPRLHASRLNQDFLTAALVSTNDSADLEGVFADLSDEKRVASARLRQAYLRLRSHVAAFAREQRSAEPGAHSDRIQSGDLSAERVERAAGKLTDLANALLKRAIYIEITVRQWSDAFAVFEGLNNRGLDLSERDLVKNAVLARGHEGGLQEEALTDLEERWQILTRRIAETKFPRFLRHYLLLHYEDVPLKRVVRTLTDHYDDRSAHEILDELDRASSAYQSITRPSTVSDQHLSAALTRFAALDADRSYPILLAAFLARIPDDDLVKLIRRVEVLYFRRSSIMGKDNKSIEADIRTVAARLFEAGADGLDEAVQDVARLTPPDDEFHHQFVRRSAMKDSVARYMLATMENFLAEDTVKVVDMNVTLEHIMPKNPVQWGLSGEELDRHPETHARLGNLTILRSKANSQLSNRPFGEKIGWYQEEQLRINELLVNRASWTSTEVSERQRWMADLACEVWPVRT